MSPKAIAVAGLSAIAIAGSGCGGDSDSASEAKFRFAFKKRFATAPSALLWYDRITGMEVVDGRLEIATDLEPDTDDVLYNAQAYAEAICQGVLNFSFSSESNAEGIKTTSVTGLDGVPLAQCRLIWPDEDSDADAENPRAATTTEQPHAVDISGLRTAFKERFGTPGNETPWYRLVTGLKVAPDAVVTVASPYARLEVETKLDPGTKGESGGVPCGAIYGLAREFMEEDAGLIVALVASDGTELGGCG